MVRCVHSRGMGYFSLFPAFPFVLLQDPDESAILAILATMASILLETGSAVLHREGSQRKCRVVHRVVCSDARCILHQGAPPPSLGEIALIRASSSIDRVAVVVLSRNSPIIEVQPAEAARVSSVDQSCRDLPAAGITLSGIPEPRTDVI